MLGKKIKRIIIFSDFKTLGEIQVSVFISKVNWNIDSVINLHSVYDFFGAVSAELNRDPVTCKA